MAGVAAVLRRRSVPIADTARSPDSLATGFVLSEQVRDGGNKPLDSSQNVFYQRVVQVGSRRQLSDGRDQVGQLPTPRTDAMGQLSGKEASPVGVTVEGA